jgi:hypothetical protein
MRRPAVWAAFAAGGLVVGGGAPSVAGSPSIVAVRAGGAVAAARPLPAGGSFALFYEHSAYRAPTVEVFAVAGHRFTMYAVASLNEAVLDYYEVEGVRSRLLGWWVLRLRAPQTIDELSLIATPVGLRTLVAGPECVPLYPRIGSYRLRIRVARSRPAGGTRPCPPGVPELLGAVRAGPAF